MTLAQLQIVQQQILAQYTAYVQTKVPDEKLALFYSDAIKLRGALEILAQLITQESVEASAPPGSTGPTL